MLQHLAFHGIYSKAFSRSTCPEHSPKTEAFRHLRKGKNSIQEIAKLTGVSVSTIQRVKKSVT